MKNYLINKKYNKLISSKKEELYKLINENKLEIEELKAKLSRYPLELLPGEKMMSIIFKSTNQEILYSIICKNTDIFVNIELKLYKVYSKYIENQNFFTVNGIMVNKYKNVEQKKIKDNDIILLNTI